MENEENLKEDSENISQEEEEETSEKTNGEPDWKAKADAMYAKYKSEQEKTKKLEEQLNKAVNQDKKVSGQPDLAKLAQDLSAFQGLDDSERERLIRESKLQESSLPEARKSDDFKYWRSAYRAEKKKNSAPEPSTKQESGRSVDASDAARKMRQGTIKKEEWDAVKDDPKKLEEFLRQTGLTRDYSPKRPGPSGSTRPPNT